MLPADRPVLFFDGMCNLCSRSVQFVLKRDRKRIFLFGSLQSPKGAAAQKQVGQAADSFILFYKGRYYIQSDAAIKTALLLGGAWKIVAAAYIVPRFIRNAVYRFVARNRYKWFGKRESCMVPRPEYAAQFLT